MIKHLQRVCLLLLAAGVACSASIPLHTAAAAAATTGATNGATNAQSNTLRVGQRLTAGGTDSDLVSTNAMFGLSLYYSASSDRTGYIGLEIQQRSDGLVGGLWRRSGAATPQAYAEMMPNGDFVLFARPGRPIWSTGTAGTGSDNRLVIQDRGNLVVLTGAGRQVWSSGTHAQLLESGQTLRPGQHLSNVYEPGAPTTRLTMRRDGDLELTYRGAVVWASNTTVPGSSLSMEPSGDLVIHHGGRTLWRTSTARFAGPDDGAPFLSVDPRGRFTISFALAYDASGPATRTVFDSSSRRGELYRKTPGPWRYLTAGSVLRPRQSLASRTGSRLTMQLDGNLVLRGPDGTLRWQSDTHRRGAVLRMSAGGSLVVRHRGHVLWVARTGSDEHVVHAANLTVVDGGALVAHDARNNRLWRVGAPG